MKLLFPLGLELQGCETGSVIATLALQEKKKKCLKIELSWGKQVWDMEPRQCMMVTSLVPLINLCLYSGFLFLFCLWHFGLGSLALGTEGFLTHLHDSLSL